MSAHPLPVTVEEIEALAARCEAASGPDRELDWEIFDAFGMKGSIHKRIAAPKFTASLDAAMPLVPWEGIDLAVWGYAFALEQRRDGRWEARADQGGDECGHGDTILGAACATAALAVTNFALRAHLQSQPSS